MEQLYQTIFCIQCYQCMSPWRWLEVGKATVMDPQLVQQAASGVSTLGAKELWVIYRILFLINHWLFRHRTYMHSQPWSIPVVAHCPGPQNSCKHWGWHSCSPGCTTSECGCGSTSWYLTRATLLEDLAVVYGGVNLCRKYLTIMTHQTWEY